MKKLISIFILPACLCCYAQDTVPNAMRQYSETELKILPVLWQQTAAEYRALCYQAFNFATLRLYQALMKKSAKRLAIITDLDETIIDNSYIYGNLIPQGKEFSAAEWKNWTSQSAATAVPGAIKFLQLAKQKRVAIFYISNRDTSELFSTVSNLKKLDLPDADTSHMLFLSNTSSKETRRQQIMKRYNVVMLLGDNLNDFMQVFERIPIDERNAEVDKLTSQWGRKFIVLPNATYGEWENAIYDYDRKLSAEQKNLKRKEKLKGY